jgi:hypothetical protein|tara:strand:- start:20073 stop:20261 length:189 start_codon:yes stop_codon:yes gene_type:complete
MPTKNKPKRFNRHRSVRVARRKRRQTALLTGNKRNRPKRPKNKNTEKAKPTTKVDNKVKKTK